MEAFINLVYEKHNRVQDTIHRGPLDEPCLVHHPEEIVLCLLHSHSYHCSANFINSFPVPKAIAPFGLVTGCPWRLGTRTNIFFTEGTFLEFQCLYWHFL